MPRNYKRPISKELYGEANAYNISIVGRDKLLRTFLKFRLPLHATWSHLKTDIEELWSDGSLKNAVAYFNGKLRTMQHNVAADVVVPISIRNGVLLDPAIFQYANKTDIFTKEAISDLFEHTQFPRPVLDRAYIFAPPPMPGTFVPTQNQIQDMYNPNIGGKGNK
jgi:hypothetical protein